MTEQLATDVLVIGAGAAGMMAAQEAAAQGANVVLVDKSVMGRGGATILAQMTVAVALGEAEPDSPEIHARDTIEGSRGLGDPDIIRLITELGPGVIRQLENFGVRWARTPDGKHSQVKAPGHSKNRCVYVDVLQTGTSVSAALRKRIRQSPGVTHLNNAIITRLLAEDGKIYGAFGFSLVDFKPLSIKTSNVVVATGGITELYQRTSASVNLTGDGMLLAAQAGAVLRDMEMVQFFPIAHLYPPLVRLDPIMWDPFRYKLGGRLLNGKGEEFMHSYSNESGAVYSATRDETSRAIFTEVEEGRGSPHGGVYLDFTMIPPDKLRTGFGGVIDILLEQGVDLTKDMIEVAPMAHFMLGGIEVGVDMETSVKGLYACGEAIYGMHGANRLSGNAITEALVTGKIAGWEAANARASGDEQAHEDDHFSLLAQQCVEEWDQFVQRTRSDDWPASKVTVGQLRNRLKEVMWHNVGPFRTEEKLQDALSQVQDMKRELAQIRPDTQNVFPLEFQEWTELSNMFGIAESVIYGAILRKESRGAHVRLDYPEQMSENLSSVFKLSDDGWKVSYRTLG